MFALLASLAFGDTTYVANDISVVRPDYVDSPRCMEVGVLKAPTINELVGYTATCDMQADGLIPVVRNIHQIGFIYRRKVFLCIPYDFPVPTEDTECQVLKPDGTLLYTWLNNIYGAWL